MSAPGEILWRPSPERIARTNLKAYMNWLASERGLAFEEFAALHAWSIAEPAAFWESIWDFCGVIGERGATALRPGGSMIEARFFPEARLNFAENLLAGEREGDAIVSWVEDRARRRVSWAELRADVAAFRSFLAASGVRAGDRVAAVLPNVPETVIAMLAAASIGAVWSSCSPDFGPAGILDRLGQIEPKVLIACDGYIYSGREFEIAAKIAEVRAKLPSVERVVIAPMHRESGRAKPAPRALDDALSFENALARHRGAPLAFDRLPFAHPLFIMFSSGTTGPPKCIVHSAGGALIQHLKEHRLHCDIKPGDRVFYYTTCGWMMWNWLVSALGSGATLLLYDGSPMHPRADVLFDYADAESMTLFGTSAKYIESIGKRGLRPRETHRLEALRVIASTGSPLAPEGFDYVYESVKRDVQLSSISGGTDLLSCFVLGNPIGPVRRGEIQARGLGMKVEVWSDDGRSVVGEKGELVCTAPFPSMPIGFWSDPDGAKYRAAYFEKFPGVWTHGDYAEIAPEGGAIVYGRSDATLNPGGVRVGTAEIYRVVERIEEVAECMAVGQAWRGDERIVLFVVTRDGRALDDALREKIRDRLRREAGPRYAPAKIVRVDDLPRTRSGKLSELAARELIHGREPKNVEALANPESLAGFRDRAELRD